MPNRMQTLRKNYENFKKNLRKIYDNNKWDNYGTTMGQKWDKKYYVVPVLVPLHLLHKTYTPQLDNFIHHH
jgi:hypothetical protein